MQTSGPAESEPFGDMSFPSSVTFIQQDEYECEFQFYLILSTFAADSQEKGKRGVPGDRRTPLGPWGVGMRPEAASEEPCVCVAGESLLLSLSTPK